jgi:outer membrane protein assembly factor BamB
MAFGLTFVGARQSCRACTTIIQRPRRNCTLLAAFLCGASVLLGGGAWGAGGDLLWQVATGGVLAASNGRVVVAGSAGVQTFDGNSGALLWQDSFFGATIVAMDAQQVIAVGANAIRTYDARNGSLDWQEALASGTLINAAEMKGNQLLVAGSAMDSTGAVQLLIRAYDARNGQIEWEDQSLPPNTRLGAGFPLRQKSLSIHGSRAYVVATVGSEPLFLPSCLIRAYDRKGGDRVWESVSDERCAANAVAAHQKQVILAGIGGAAVDDFLVRSYNAQTGELLWQDRTFVGTGFDNEAVAVDDEGKRAFLAGWVRWIPGRFNQEAFLVRAYNMQTGELYWEDQYPGSAGPCLCHARDIVVEGRRVFAVGIVPFIVRAYDARSGTLLWQNELPTGLAASVAVDRGVVFAADGGVLRAYAAK